MALTDYNYPLTAFPNQIVEPVSLTSQINNSSISTPLDHIDTSIGCDIWFTNALSANDQTTLNAIVAAHTGVFQVTVGSAPQSISGGAMLVIPTGQDLIFFNDLLIQDTSEILIQGTGGLVGL